MQQKERDKGPMYSIGIHGIALPSFDGSFGVPDYSGTLAQELETEDGAEKRKKQLRISSKATPHRHVISTGKGAVADSLSIQAEEGSVSSLMLSTVSAEKFVRTILVDLAQGARQTLILVPTGAGETYITLNATLARGAELTLVQVFTEGAKIKYQEEITLAGEAAGVHVVTLAMPSGSSELDLSTHVSHKGDHTRGHVRALGFLRGRSRTTYRATGDILKHVQSPDSHETAKFIIADLGAELNVIPSLDIASNQVATSHTLAVYQMSEKELYYPKLRGLNSEAARELLEEGLLDAELACLKNSDIVSEIKAQIAKQQSRKA